MRPFTRFSMAARRPMSVDAEPIVLETAADLRKLFSGVADISRLSLN